MYMLVDVGANIYGEGKEGHLHSRDSKWAVRTATSGFPSA